MSGSMCSSGRPAVSVESTEERTCAVLGPPLIMALNQMPASSNCRKLAGSRLTSVRPYLSLAKRTSRIVQKITSPKTGPTSWCQDFTFLPSRARRWKSMGVGIEMYLRCNDDQVRLFVYLARGLTRKLWRIEKREDLELIQSNTMSTARIPDIQKPKFE